MVKFAHYKQEDFEFLNYKLNEEQSSFTKNVAYALELTEHSEKAVPVTILFDNQPIGFLILDFGEDKLALTSNPDSVLFRSLSKISRERHRK